MRSIYLLLLCTCGCLSVSAQMRLIGLGSSTTGGTGAYPNDSSWLRRFSYHYKNQLGQVDTVHNLGWPGASPYRAMPSSYVPPPNRQGPFPPYNVTNAVSLLAGLPVAANGVVIVNFPTNAYDTLPVSEIMFCLQLIYDSATRLGNKCFVTTTQPREGGNFNDPAVKRKLADLKDSIINRFGVANTLNFYDGMYNPVDSFILPAYRASDGIHYNNAGHRELFERVKAKNVFNSLLPVKLHSFTVRLQQGQVILDWRAEHDDPDGGFTIERSTNGKDYEPLQTLPVQRQLGSHSYRFTDEYPVAGESYYRLAVRERDHTYYSKAMLVKIAASGLTIKKIYPVPAAKQLQVQLETTKAREVAIDVLTAQGIPVLRITGKLAAGTNYRSLPVSSLPAGMYYLRMSSAGEAPVIRSFTK